MCICVLQVLCLNCLPATTMTCVVCDRVCFHLLRFQRFAEVWQFAYWQGWAP